MLRRGGVLNSSVYIRQASITAHRPANKIAHYRLTEVVSNAYMEMLYLP